MTNYKPFSDEAIFKKKPADMDPAERELFELQTQTETDALMHKLRHAPQLRDAVIMRLAKQTIDSKKTVDDEARGFDND